MTGEIRNNSRNMLSRYSMLWEDLTLSEGESVGESVGLSVGSTVGFSEGCAKEQMGQRKMRYLSLICNKGK